MKLRNLKTITKEQKRILDGLAQISEEVSGFYQDALLILSDDCVLSSKVNLIAHLTREIDGGFRQIFAPKELYKKESDAGQGHYASILIAMGFENKAMADEWYSIANKFPSFAHRHGLESRTLKEFQALWLRYEKLLVFLVGSSYAFQDRIKQLASLNAPTEDILSSMKYFLKDIQNEFLFYKTLEKPNWLIPLKNNGFFDLGPVLPSIVDKGSQYFPEWLPLRYLANIAASVNTEQEAAITGILNEVYTKIIAKQLYLDEYAIYLICKIIHGLPNYIFGQKDVDFLNAFCNYWQSPHKIYENVLTEDLLVKYVQTGSSLGVINIVVYCLSYRKQERIVEGFEEYKFSPQISFQPNISDVYQHTLNQNLKDVIDIGGVTLILKLIKLLANLSEDQPYEVNNIPSIEFSDQRGLGYGDWSWNLIDFLSKGCELLDAKDRKALVVLLFGEKAPIFKRIAFHLIRLSYVELGDFFWDYIGRQTLDGLSPIHEIYLLLQQISPNLTTEQFIEIISWIEKMEMLSEHFNAEDLEKSKYYRIRKYLNSLNPTESNQQNILSEIKAKYEKLSNYPLEHPEFDSYSSFSNGYDLPENSQDLEKMDISELVKFLNEHTKVDNFDTSAEGLGLLLNNFIINDVQKYLTQLPQILSLRPEYLRNVIGAFDSILKNDGLDDWRPLLIAFNDRVKTKGFETEDKFIYANQAIVEIAEFLLILSDKNEKFNFEKQDIQWLTKMIIDYLNLEQYKDLEHISKGYIDYQLNSLQGKLFKALINFSRLWSQTLEADEPHRLPDPVLSYLNANLHRSSETDKGYSLGLGYHFAYILYADRGWCEQNAKLIFSDECKLHKDYTMNGLMSPYNHIYRSVVDYLRDQKLNKYAVELYQEDSAELAKLCRYAIIEYIEPGEAALGNPQSLISLIIERGNPVQYKKLINVAVDMQIVYQDKIKSLWEILLNKCLVNPNKFADPLNNIILFGTLLFQLSDEIANLIERSIPFLTGDRITFSTIKFLLNMSSSNFEKAGELILSVWQKTKIRIYVSSELVKFIEALYIKDLTDLADELCVYVAKTGEMGLKSTYDNYKLAQFK